MLENPTPLPNRVHSGPEASAVIARPIVIAAPPLEVDRSHWPPKLARRMRYHWEGTVIETGISRLRPRINEIQTGVTPGGLDKQSGHNRRTKRGSTTAMSGGVACEMGVDGAHGGVCA